MFCRGRLFENVEESLREKAQSSCNANCCNFWGRGGERIFPTCSSMRTCYRLHACVCVCVFVHLTSGRETDLKMVIFLSSNNNKKMRKNDLFDRIRMQKGWKNIIALISLLKICNSRNCSDWYMLLRAFVSVCALRR